ncbi:MAG: nucleotidyltransferase family protein [Anaerolineae bacterium]
MEVQAGGAEHIPPTGACSRLSVNALIEERRGELEQLCRRYHVRRLALFGSGSGDAFDPARSDLDFAVEFAPVDPHQHKESYFGLLAALEDLFARPIDLAEYGAMRNPYFRRAMLESEVPLYEAA